ncbi:MAG: hypothetical protein BWZ01_00572 [Deltaproteobacteria bacterium ADurb.BinA179]|nr:MAG: hypothetical protein BWZ01_00572 [Deltaproteobacteria bacterium ADurb.BinA179]
MAAPGAEILVRGLLQLRSGGCCGADESVHGAQVIAVLYLIGQAQDLFQHGGHHEYPVDTLILDEAEKFAWVELFHDHARAAQQDEGHPCGNSARMVERARDETAHVLRDRIGDLGAAEVVHEAELESHEPQIFFQRDIGRGGEVAEGIADAVEVVHILGCARCASGVGVERHDKADIGHAPGRLPDQVFIGDHTLRGAVSCHDTVLNRGDAVSDRQHLRHELAAQNQRPGPGGVDRIDEVLASHVPVEKGHGAPDQGAGEECLEELVSVVEQLRTAVFGPEAERLHAVCQPHDPGLHVRIGVPSCFRYECLAVSEHLPQRYEKVGCKVLEPEGKERPQ